MQRRAAPPGCAGMPPATAQQYSRRGSTDSVSNTGNQQGSRQGHHTVAIAPHAGTGARTLLGLPASACRGGTPGRVLCVLPVQQPGPRQRGCGLCWAPSRATLWRSLHAAPIGVPALAQRRHGQRGQRAGLLSVRRWGDPLQVRKAPFQLQPAAAPHLCQQGCLDAMLSC